MLFHLLSLGPLTSFLLCGLRHEYRGTSQPAEALQPCIQGEKECPRYCKLIKPEVPRLCNKAQGRALVVGEQSAKTSALL